MQTNEEIKKEVRGILKRYSINNEQLVLELTIRMSTVATAAYAEGQVDGIRSAMDAVKLSLRP